MQANIVTRWFKKLNKTKKNCQCFLQEQNSVASHYPVVLQWRAPTRRSKANLLFPRSVFIIRDSIQTVPMKPYSIQATRLPLMHGTSSRMCRAATPATHHFLYVTCKRAVYNCEIQSINSTALCGPLFIYSFPFPLRNTSENVTMKRLRNNSSDAINNSGPEHGTCSGPLVFCRLFFLSLFSTGSFLQSKK